MFCYPRFTDEAHLVEATYPKSSASGGTRNFDSKQSVSRVQAVMLCYAVL